MNESATLERETPTPRGTRRRVGRVVVGLVGVLALSTGIGVLAWLLTYQPLTYGNGRNLPEAKTIETVGLGTEYQFRATQAGTFEVWVQIENSGPRAVTIEEIMPEQHYYWRFKEAAVGAFGPEPYGNFGREFRPFTPQRMESGDYLWHEAILS